MERGTCWPAGSRLVDEWALCLPRLGPFIYIYIIDLVGGRQSPRIVCLEWKGPAVSGWEREDDRSSPFRKYSEGNLSTFHTVTLFLLPFQRYCPPEFPLYSASRLFTLWVPSLLYMSLLLWCLYATIICHYHMSLSFLYLG